MVHRDMGRSNRFHQARCEGGFSEGLTEEIVFVPSLERLLVTQTYHISELRSGV